MSTLLPHRGERGVPDGQRLSLNSVVRIKENEVGAAHGINNPLGPERAQRRLFGDLMSEEDCVFQHATPLQSCQRIGDRTPPHSQNCQLVKQLRGEMPEFIGSSKVIEMFVVISRSIVRGSQVPANSKAAILHQMPKQSELSEVANSSNVLNAHGTPNG